MRKYGAACVLIALWLGFWIGHGILSYHMAYEQAKEHQQVFEVGQFWLEWMRDTLENNQSEMLQIIVAAWVFKHFLWSGSPESKDTQ